MSDNEADVVLLTEDRQLRNAILKHRPPSVSLRCLTPSDLTNSELPAAAQWWVDLDCENTPDLARCRRRVYFYSQLPTTSGRLPTGLFLRKPCAVPALAVLWAGVRADKDECDRPLVPDHADDRGPIPAWLLEFHELGLRRFCHKCVELLPTRFGYADVALYLHDAEQRVLTLAETNSQSCVDLAIPLTSESEHVLAEVARAGRTLTTPDLAETCRASGMHCPAAIEQADDRGVLIVPLITGGRLSGLLQFRGRRVTTDSEVGLPLERVRAFLARCLEHARRHARARVEARVDRLTGLFNYRWMIEALGKEIHRARRYDNSLALIMIDLDDLKPVNDRFGHRAGDALLRHAAGKITAALRQIDSAARVGGDEFVVLLPATDLAGAQHVARRILTAIRTDAPVINRRALPVTASLGVAQWQDGWDQEQFLDAADKAMYAAKRRGPNRLGSCPHGLAVKAPTDPARARAKSPRPPAPKLNSSSEPIEARPANPRP